MHVHPDTSVTVLINNMYTHFGMDKQIIDEHDTGEFIILQKK